MGIYLDNAATSYPKPDAVIQKMMQYMKEIGATAGRGAYKTAIEADRLVFNTRKMVCKLFNGNDPSKVIFTYNITEALNMVINGFLKEGAHVITSSLEHNSVWRPLKTLERDRNIEISKVPCTKEGITKASDIEKLIKPNTKLIVFTYASNVIGTIQPIKEIGIIAKKHNILFLVDSAQTAGSYPIDVVKDNIDILAFTGHKSLLGPTGTGGFLINCDSDANIMPSKSGGTGGDSSYPYQPDYLPNKYEAGTLNVAGIIGLGEALNFICSTGIENIRKKEQELVKYALQRLDEIDGIHIYGPKDYNKIVGVIAFNLENIPAEDIAFELDRKYNIMVRVGIHCAPTAHELIGTLERGAVRIGIGYFNSKDDIDKLVSALKNIEEKI
ncbi:aminotransferase class V-fold PLP-dependent enzyme [Clostridium fermenticellae]|uniref:cysteine desulfurase n=1 Tax=Clostridium fermenticellae TaxID=2068654 RepID=A0A386H2H3_9CLOT|nr:aminotransferase class V-fold PLP-dependent enzyme [Clostridium fermenticellae]AYD39911.1 aminotransferase class V-fold PLP-dependent enzyme [Clostridium fermenticellae]